MDRDKIQFKCYCGSTDLRETHRKLSGEYEPKKDTNNFTCRACGAKGQLKDLDYIIKEEK